LFEVGDSKDLAHVAIAIEQTDLRMIATGVIAQQQQHAEGGAVEVGGALQVNLVALGRAVDAFVGIAKRLMGAEIKTPLNGNGQFLPVGADFGERDRSFR
jgi:hypothetical protein